MKSSWTSYRHGDFKVFRFSPLIPALKFQTLLDDATWTSFEAACQSVVLSRYLVNMLVVPVGLSRSWWILHDGDQVHASSSASSSLSKNSSRSKFIVSVRGRKERKQCDLFLSQTSPAAWKHRMSLYSSSSFMWQNPDIQHRRQQMIRQSVYTLVNDFLSVALPLVPTEDKHI